MHARSSLVVAVLVACAFSAGALADVIVDRGPKRVPISAEVQEGGDIVLPQGVKVTGKPVALASFVDSKGEHVVVVSVTDVKTTKPTNPDDEAMSERHLFGAQFTLLRNKAKSGGPPRVGRVWETKDWIKDCPLDLVVEYVPGSLEITDLDNDGTAESFFAYRMTCAGDVGPLTLKLLVHEGETKYAVRGTTRVTVGTDEAGKPISMGGDMALDDAFKTAPKALAAHATMRFEAFTNAGGY